MHTSRAFAMSNSQHVRTYSTLARFYMKIVSIPQPEFRIAVLALQSDDLSNKRCYDVRK